MKVRYDADAMYIEFIEEEFHRKKKLDENTILDLDKEENIIGIEILFAKERMPKLLKKFKKDKLISA